jgi:RNA polymerase sigma-70 factor (ECF subfamily)
MEHSHLDLVHQLATRVGETLCDELLALERPADAIASLLSRAMTRGRFAIDDSEFIAYLAARLPETTKLSDLDQLHVDDLYLACALSHGDAAAMRVFEKEYVSDLRAAIASVDRSGIQRDDILQLVRARLFVADELHPPRIADYTGRGRLFSWLRVVVVREAISAVRKPKREALVEEVPEAAVEDFEVGVWKGMYQREFKQAFSTAVSELTPRERNLLRLHLIDQLSIDEIGASHQTHRTTAARWLRDIRAKLAARTRDLLTSSLELSGADLDSVMHLVRSRLELSVSRLLKAP